MPKAKYNFIDAQQMHRENPRTFGVPEPDELRSVKAGSVVKVCHNNERFWVTVTAVKGKKVKGRVDNDLICEQPFGYGDEVEFTKDNIYCIW